MKHLKNFTLLFCDENVKNSWKFMGVASWFTDYSPAVMLDLLVWYDKYKYCADDFTGDL